MPPSFKKARIQPLEITTEPQESLQEIVILAFSRLLSWEHGGHATTVPCVCFSARCSRWCGELPIIGQIFLGIPIIS